MLLASKKHDTLNLLVSKSDVTFTAAAKEGELDGFDFVAYNGGAIYLNGRYWPVVFDLATMKYKESTPVLADHDQTIPVGHTTKLKVAAASIRGTATLSGVNDKTNEIKATAKNGFPWQLSIGVETVNVEFVDSQGKVKVNGKTFTGPVYVAREGNLREISVLTLGADSETSVNLHAHYKGGSKVNEFEEYVTKELGLDPATITEAQRTAFKAGYDAIQKAKLNAGKNDPPQLDAAEMNRQLETFKINLQKAATETTLAVQSRLDSVKQIAAQYGNPEYKDKEGKKQSLVAFAIKENWSLDKVELECVKLSRANIGFGDGSSVGDVERLPTLLAAALAQAGKSPTLEKDYKPEILDAAHTRFKGRIGLQEIMMEAARANGYTGSLSFKSNYKAIIRHAFMKASAFSSLDIPTILGNNFNTFLMAGYTSVNNNWREISKIGRVSDFKEVTNLRLSGIGNFKRIAPDGHIEHGELTEQDFGNKAELFALMIVLTYVDMVNDNLGALTDIPRMIGRDGAMTLVEAFWAEFMNNAAFFVAGNNNVSAGALGVSGLSAALAVFRKLVDPQGRYLNSEPAYLVAPTELEIMAFQLYGTTNLVGGNATVLDSNPHVRKYKPIISPYLSNSSFTGNSAVAYYLIDNPQNVPVIETVFLDGVEVPQVETSDVDFSQLGVQWRGTYAFGVRKQDPNGGVKSTGV